jgi:hypothetical protein
MGTDARQGKAGILELDRSGLKLDTKSASDYYDGLPQVLQAAAERLRKAAEIPEQEAAAERALYHLIRLARRAG